MSYLNRMYGRNAQKPAPESNKNPNRVTGGLRAQGADTLVMLGEDGSQQEIPSLQYVRSLEEQSKKQRASLTVLERKLARCESTIDQLTSVVSRLSR